MKNLYKNTFDQFLTEELSPKDLRDQFSRDIGLRTSRAQHRGDSVNIKGEEYSVSYYTKGSSYMSIEFKGKKLENLLNTIKDIMRKNKVPFGKSVPKDPTGTYANYRIWNTGVLDITFAKK